MKQSLPCGALALLIALAGCRKHTDPAPFISGVSPLKGAYGTEVSISGKYFNSASTSVAFNHLAAEIVSSSDTMLKVKVPKGAQTGDITINPTDQYQLFQANLNFKF